MKTHNKLKAQVHKDDEISNREKAEFLFILFFVVFLAVTVLSFVLAGVSLVLETAK